MLGPGQLTPEAVETAHVAGDVIAALAPVGVYVTIEVAIAAVGLGRRLRADPRVVAIFVAFDGLRYCCGTRLYIRGRSGVE